MSKRSKNGYLQVGVETYGGGIWHSWFDRDLSIAGRVVIAESDTAYVSKLIKINRPLLRIPTLAIHCEHTTFYLLNSRNVFHLVERGAADNFQFNTETQFIPILGQVAAELNAPKERSEYGQGASSIQNNHHSSLLSLLAEELGVTPGQIHDFEL